MSKLSARRAGRPASLWRHPAFLKLWAARTVSVLGSQFTRLALPLTAALFLGASPTAMELLAAASAAPIPLFGLVAGAWVDRLPRRPVLVACDLGSAALLALVPALALAGALRMAHLWAIAFLVGTLNVVFSVASQAYLPALVDRARLVEGNSRFEVSRAIGQMGGPSLAGLTIQALGAPLALAVDAVSFLLSGALLGAIGGAEPAPDRVRRAPLPREVREGLAFVFASPYLRAVAGAGALGNFCYAGTEALYLLFVTGELGVTPAAIGVVFSFGGLGAFLGASLTGRLAARLGVGPVLVGTTALLAVLNFVPALATPAVALPVLVAAGFLGPVVVVVNVVTGVSLCQALTPARLQDRVNATMYVLTWGAVPLGGLLGGALGQALGLRPTILLTATCHLAAVLLVLLSPVRVMHAMPDTAADDGAAAERA